MKRLLPLYILAFLLNACTEEKATFQSCTTQFPVFESSDRLAPFLESRTGNPLLQKDADFLLAKLGLEKGQTLIPFAKLLLEKEQDFTLLLFKNKDKATLLSTFDREETLIDNISLPSNTQFNGLTKTTAQPLPYLEFTIEKTELNKDYKEEIPVIYTQTVNISTEGRFSSKKATFNNEKSIPLLRKNNTYCGAFTYKRPGVSIRLSLYDGKDENSYAYDLRIKSYKGCRHSVISYRGKTMNAEKEVSMHENGLLKIKLLDKNTVEIDNKNYIKNCKDDWPFTIKLRREGTWRYTESKNSDFIYIEDSLSGSKEESKRILKIFEESKSKLPPSE